MTFNELLRCIKFFVVRTSAQGLDKRTSHTRVNGTTILLNTFCEAPRHIASEPMVQ
jgi:hypothetical protein